MFLHVAMAADMSTNEELEDPTVPTPSSKVTDNLKVFRGKFDGKRIPHHPQFCFVFVISVHVLAC